MEAPSLTAAVRAELLAHPGVTEGTHRFGGIVFRLRGHELGHLHGETVADLPFPPHIRDELVTSGRVSAHDVDPDSRWVSRTVNGPDDVAQIVALFRMSYEHAAAQPARTDERQPDHAPAPDAPRRRAAAWRDVLAVSRRPILRRGSRR